jgi:hypothetical protein
MPKFGLKTVGMNFFKYLYRHTYSNVFLLVLEDVSENFNVSYYCKNLKIWKHWCVPTENRESRAQLDELQVSLLILSKLINFTFWW